jgi:hypothetical protein
LAATKRSSLLLFNKTNVLWGCLWHLFDRVSNFFSLKNEDVSAKIFSAYVVDEEKNGATTFGQRMIHQMATGQMATGQMATGK